MHDDKRTRIMEALEELLTSKRWHEITTDEVAAVAKVGKGTLYKHFADKDDLFFQTATAGFDELCGVLGRVDLGAPFEGQLLEACGQISGFFRRRRQVFRLMQAEDGQSMWCRPDMRERWHEKRRSLLDAVAAVMQRGIDAGVIRPDASPAVLASLFLGMLRTRARELGDLPDEQKADRVLVDLFLNGSRAGAGVAEPARVDGWAAAGVGHG